MKGEPRANGGATKRVLAVNPTGLASGAETVLVRLLRAARGRGWEVAAAIPDGELCDQLSREGFARVRIPDLKLPGGWQPAGLALAAARAARAAVTLRRAAQPEDLVVANGLLALPALRLARLRSPVVWIAHDVVVRPDRRRVLRACGPAVTLAVAVSEAVAGPLREAGITVTVVRNGTTFPIEPAPLDHAGPPVIGVNALLTSWKGQDVLLDAVGRLDRGDVLVELLGGSFPKDREYVQRLRERTTRPDLVGRVRFLGKVDDPLARMRGWSISVLPSVDPEAAPLSLLEAMSIGIPAVATNHGGAAEVLGDAGLLVPPRDPDALAAAIGHLVDDRDLRRRCAQAGPRLIAAGLTLEVQEQAFLRVLEAVTDRAPVG